MTLYSCGNAGSQMKPIKTELIDFDIGVATQMVGKGEKIIVDTTVKDTVSRQEYKQFLNDLHTAYDGYEEAQWEYMFFYNEEFEDEEVLTLHLNKDMLYPTIYHEDVEIVSAQVENTYYQDEFFNRSILTIREEYLGKDSKLEGWHREYLYKKNEDKWLFYTFSGQVNLSGEGLTSDYLIYSKTNNNKNANPGHVTNNSSDATLSTEKVQDYNEVFELNLFSDKEIYKTTDKIKIWATLKYVGSDSQIKIWHGDPYISFTITDGKDFNTGGFFHDILTSTVLIKDKLYTFDYAKSGGYSADDIDADFWEKFYKEKDLYLPEGEYRVKVSGAFSLHESMKERSNLVKELVIKIDE